MCEVAAGAPQSAQPPAAAPPRTSSASTDGASPARPAAALDHWRTAASTSPPQM